MDRAFEIAQAKFRAEKAAKIEEEAERARAYDIEAYQAKVWETGRKRLARQEAGEDPDKISKISKNQYNQGDNSSEWGPLRWGKLPTAREFPKDVFPETMDRAIEAIANATSCHRGLCGGNMLAMGGATIGRTVRLQVRANWYEISSFYLAIVQPTGVGKSPVRTYLMGELDRIEDHLAQDFAARKADYLQRKEGEKPVPQRLIVRHTTNEALFKTLSTNMRGVLIDQDELASLFGGMNQYRGGKGSDWEQILHLWTGQPTSIDRVKNEFGEPLRIPNPCLNIVGGIQPGKLGMISGKDDDGMLDRFLVVYPDQAPKMRFSDRREVSDGDLAGWRRILRNLWSLDFTSYEGMTIPQLAKFDDAGFKAYSKAFDDLVDEENAQDFPSCFKGTWSKLEAYLGRCCLALALFHRADSTATMSVPLVSEFIVSRAVKLIEYFKDEAIRVNAHFRGFGDANLPQGAKLVLNWLRNHQGAMAFSESELGRSYQKRDYDQAQIKDGLGFLQRVNVIRRHPEPDRDPKTPGRKPAQIWEVHPEFKN